mmetsp:Transcript_41747/g.99860  ORF Transcript_41747/g.99860 Transcript_41747/m.99860 type:complete len:203 (+) Transcript_41747:1220-1828(+)
MRRPRTMPNTLRNSSGVTGTVMIDLSAVTTSRSVESSLLESCPMRRLTSFAVRNSITLARVSSSTSSPTQCFARAVTQLPTFAFTTVTSPSRATASSAGLGAFMSWARTSAIAPALATSCAHSLGRLRHACMRTSAFSSSHRSICASSASLNSAGNLGMNSGTFSAANILALVEPVLHTPSRSLNAPLRSAGPMLSGAVISP